MTGWNTMALCAVLLFANSALAQPGEVTSLDNVDYVEHDGVKLTGDLYAPKGLAKAPVVVAIHGGGWRGGSPAAYKYWGPYLARNGIATFAIKYRLAKEGTYPKAVYDGKSAIQFVRARAGDLGVDPERIALFGESAGGHLAALLGLATNEYKSEYRSDPNAGVPANVKAVVSFFGIFLLPARLR